MLPVPVIIISILAFWLINCVKILKEYERGVIFRLGRVLPQAKGPGIIFVFVPIDKMVRVSLRLIAVDVPPQDVIKKDNVSLKGNTLISYSV